MNAIRFWVYALPFPLFAVMYWVWVKWSGNHAFAFFVMFLPVVYGYIAPGIATNLLKKWRFKGPWVVGSYYAHHGFMYSANMSPLLFLAFLGTPTEPLTMGTSLRIIACTGALHGFVLWIHDILIVRHRMVEIYNRPAKEGRSPEEIVTYYAPLCFFIIGACYAAGALIAYQTFVLKNNVCTGSIVWVWLTGATLLFTLPSMAYRGREKCT